MTIHPVTPNNRRKAFHVKTSKQPSQLPHSRVDLHPGVADPLVRVFVDKELRGEERYAVVLVRERCSESNNARKGLIVTGEPAGTRTQGPRLKRAMLYRLSYRLTEKKAQILPPTLSLCLAGC